MVNISTPDSQDWGALMAIVEESKRDGGGEASCLHWYVYCI